MKEYLHFVVTGEWVTEHLRRLFYAERQDGEHRTLDDIMETALSCMCGTEMTENQLKVLAADVLLGKRKFIGRTDDGSYSLVEDTENSDKEIYAKFVEKNYFMPRYTFDLVYQSLITFQKNREWEDKRDEVAKFADNYGWLSPTGEFFPVEWGDHTQWAYDYIDEHNLWEQVKVKSHNTAGDFLTERGWILLHNPQQGEAFVTSNTVKRPTKRQREFLYDYYTRRGNFKEAKRWLEDE